MRCRRRWQQRHAPSPQPTRRDSFDAQWGPTAARDAIGCVRRPRMPLAQVDAPVLRARRCTAAAPNKSAVWVGSELARHGRDALSRLRCRHACRSKAGDGRLHSSGNILIARAVSAIVNSTESRSKV
jgi:hypothetical protein